MRVAVIFSGNVYGISVRGVNGTGASDVTDDVGPKESNVIGVATAHVGIW